MCVWHHCFLCAIQVLYCASDYCISVIDYSPTSGALIISSGDNTGCIDIQLIADSIIERTEIFTISFNSSDISDVVVDIIDTNGKEQCISYYITCSRGKW